MPTYQQIIASSPFGGGNNASMPMDYSARLKSGDKGLVLTGNAGERN